jgi:hypothetical protein
MPLESTQFRRRNHLAAERELQDLADIGLDQSVDFLLGDPLAAERFDGTVVLAVMARAICTIADGVGPAENN